MSTLPAPQGAEMTREAMQAVYGWARTSGPGSEGAPLFLLGDSAGRWADFATYVPLYASPSAAAQADAKDAGEAEFCIEDAGGMFLASTQGSRDEAWREIQHYAAQYIDEGPVTIYEVTRRLVATVHSEGGKP